MPQKVNEYGFCVGNEVIAFDKIYTIVAFSETSPNSILCYNPSHSGHSGNGYKLVNENGNEVVIGETYKDHCMWINCSVVKLVHKSYTPPPETTDIIEVGDVVEVLSSKYGSIVKGDICVVHEKRIGGFHVVLKKTPQVPLFFKTIDLKLIAKKDAVLPTKLMVHPWAVGTILNIDGVQHVVIGYSNCRQHVYLLWEKSRTVIDKGWDFNDEFSEHMKGFVAPNGQWFLIKEIQQALLKMPAGLHVFEKHAESKPLIDQMQKAAEDSVREWFEDSAPKKQSQSTERVKDVHSVDIHIKKRKIIR